MAGRNRGAADSVSAAGEGGREIKHQGSTRMRISMTTSSGYERWTRKLIYSWQATSAGEDDRRCWVSLDSLGGWG